MCARILVIHMQCACAVLYCHVRPVRFYNILPHYLINGTIFEKRKKLMNTRCVFRFSLQLLSETFLILRRTERDMIKNVYLSSCKVPVILVTQYWNLNFLDKFSRNAQISNSVQISRVRAELFHADRQTDRRTDMTNSIVALGKFTNAPKNIRDCRPK